MIDYTAILDKHIINYEPKMEKFWVNYQKQHDFNSLHDHTGVYSFVIWLKIPIEFEDQNKDNITNTPLRSAFQFSFTDLLGRLNSYTFKLSNGKEVNVVYPFYAHLNEIEFHDVNGIVTKSEIIKGQTIISKDFQIGTIGNANGYYGSAYHLHFEIKLNPNNVPGAGYMNLSQTIIDVIDPLEFIQNNKQLNQKEWSVFVHPYEIDSSKSIYVSLDQAQWKAQARENISQRRSLGYGDFLWSKKTSSESNASWHAAQER